MGLEDFLNLRHVDTCRTCRYYRVHTTGASVSECLLMGRTLAIDVIPDNLAWRETRICNGWKKRPHKWDIYSRGTTRNPHWKDPYLPRIKLETLRGGLARRANHAKG